MEYARKVLKSKVSIQYINMLIRKYKYNLEFKECERRIFYAYWGGKIIVCYNEEGECFIEEYCSIMDFLDDMNFEVESCC